MILEKIHEYRVAHSQIPQANANHPIVSTQINIPFIPPPAFSSIAISQLRWNEKTKTPHKAPSLKFHDFPPDIVGIIKGISQISPQRADQGIKMYVLINKSTDMIR